MATLLLSTALVATALALILSRRDIAQVRREQQEVMEHTGYIDVSDPTKVYVRELRCPVPQTWQFQVYAPPGHQLMGGIGADLEAGETYPSRLLQLTSFRRLGHSTITISLKKERGKWWLSNFDQHGNGSIITVDDFSWLVPREHQKWHGAKEGERVHGTVRVFDPTQRIPIFVLKNDKNKGTKNQQENDGSLMIWLEPNLKENFQKRRKAE